MAIYYGGGALLHAPTFDPMNPIWTKTQIGLMLGSLAGGGIAFLFGFVFALTIEVKSERICETISAIWYHIIYSVMIWPCLVGGAMSLALGKDAAKTLIVSHGIKQASVHVFTTGGIIGLGLGICFRLGEFLRLPFRVFLVCTLAADLMLARWYFRIYAINSTWWIGIGVLFWLFLNQMVGFMITKDRKERAIAIEEHQ